MLKIVKVAGRMVAILDQTFVSGSRYFRVTVISRAHIANIFCIVVKGRNFGYFVHNVAYEVC
jgi:hypothetical protein